MSTKDAKNKFLAKPEKIRYLCGRKQKSKTQTAMVTIANPIYDNCGNCRQDMLQSAGIFNRLSHK